MPRAGALEQSLVLERTERTVKRSADVTREVGTWPGGRQAVLVRWTEQQPRPGGPDAAPSLRNWQLLVEVNDGLILNGLATAPVERFEEAQVGTVLRTFRPRAAST